ncbi:hypothetical protein [Actinophytocola sp.]|uniref:hypothetical protein n=1 Tax=Actinophytocola sp. TaxID=1872138 RepID=UPI002EDA30CA
MAAIVLPVGHDLGAFHPGDGAAAVRQVRLGAEIVELSTEEFQVWSLAHGIPSGDTVSCTPADLSSPLSSPDAVAALRDRGLLAEVTPDSAQRFAAAHRLLPLALGLGNTAEEPWLFSVGLLYQPLVMMTGALFDLWQWAHLSPDLWLACRESAEVATRAGADDADVTDPARVLAGALGSLHQLLVARVACLDVRIEGVR